LLIDAIHNHGHTIKQDAEKQRAEVSGILQSDVDAVIVLLWAGYQLLFNEIFQ